MSEKADGADEMAPTSAPPFFMLDTAANKSNDPVHGCRPPSLLCLPFMVGSICVRADTLPSALRPAGIQASRILDLWHLTLWVCAIVFAAILVALFLAILKGTGAEAAHRGQTSTKARGARRARRAVTVATGVSSALLVGLVGVDIAADRALSRLPVDDALHVEMVGHQWWWETRYRDPDGSEAFAVASDLHVPVGRPVVVSLKSADVIHTFWVPNLHGKKDMLPGRAATIEFRADQPGTYRGQCAEFCGLEHALMAFTVTAVSPADYARWEAHQRSPGTAPADAEALRGRELFLSRNCAQCHTVKGTTAEGTLGPDLTHLASRQTIAAGTIPNERAKLAAWIVNPQSLKPGSTMPESRLEPDDVRALVAYLGALR